VAAVVNRIHPPTPKGQSTTGDELAGRTPEENIMMSKRFNVRAAARYADASGHLVLVENGDETGSLTVTLR
jgi:hypothetical protein